MATSSIISLVQITGASSAAILALGAGIFTPPLPDVKTSKISDTVEQITLAPYGSTHLRVTIFPNLGRSKA